MDKNKEPLFCLGLIVTTPAALAALDEADELAADFINRHVRGDWGNVGENDADRNDEAIWEGGRIMSEYELVTLDEFVPAGFNPALWIVTEADRSVTTLLLPEEY